MPDKLLIHVALCSTNTQRSPLIWHIGRFLVTVHDHHLRRASVDLKEELDQRGRHPDNSTLWLVISTFGVLLLTFLRLSRIFNNPSWHTHTHHHHLFMCNNSSQVTSVLPLSYWSDRSRARSWLDSLGQGLPFPWSDRQAATATALYLSSSSSSCHPRACTLANTHVDRPPPSRRLTAMFITANTPSCKVRAGAS